MSNRIHAFTLIETIAVIVVMGLLAGMIVPVVASSTNAFATMSEARDRTESASLAMERIVRAVREVDDDPDVAGAADLSIASVSRIRFADGTEVRLDGTTLWLDEPDETEAPLCQHVSAFEVTYLGDDGLELDPGVAANLPLVRRLHIRIACSNAAELRTSVFLRSSLEGA